MVIDVRQNTSGYNARWAGIIITTAWAGEREREREMKTKRQGAREREKTNPSQSLMIAPRDTNLFHFRSRMISLLRRRR